MEQSPTFRNCLSCLLHVPIHFLLCKMETSAPTCGRDFPFLSGNIARLLAQLPGRWAWPHCWVLAKGIGVWRRRSNASLVWKKKKPKTSWGFLFPLFSFLYSFSMPRATWEARCDSGKILIGSSPWVQREPLTPGPTHWTFLLQETRRCCSKPRRYPGLTTAED